MSILQFEDSSGVGPDVGLIEQRVMVAKTADHWRN